MLRAMIVVCCAVMLQGCILHTAMQGIEDTTAFVRTKWDRITGKETVLEEERTRIVTQSVHCYKTLAQVDCYGEEQAGQEGRYMGRLDVPLQANVIYHMGKSGNEMKEVEAPKLAGLRREEEAPVKIDMGDSKKPTEEEKSLENVKVRIGDKDFALSDLPESEAIKDEAWK